MRFEAGVDYNFPTGGNVEYNGEVFKVTNDATSGRGYLLSNQIFRLTANGSAIGPAISNFFGANSALNLVAGGEYEITAYCYFTKTTAGTVTFTLTSSSAPVNVNGILQTGAVAGGTAIGAANQAAFFNSTSTAAAFGATGSLTTGVSHAVIMKFIYEANASVAPNIRINITQSLGTATPLRNSYYTVTRIANGNEATLWPDIQGQMQIAGKQNRLTMARHGLRGKKWRKADIPQFLFTTVPLPRPRLRQAIWSMASWQ
jgi:hypothetical protein